MLHCSITVIRFARVWGGELPAPRGGMQRIRTMIFAPLIISLQSKFRKRRRYLRAVAEVKGLSTRDLIDLRADATDMLRCLKNEFDGEPQ